MGEVCFVMIPTGLSNACCPGCGFPSTNARGDLEPEIVDVEGDYMLGDGIAGHRNGSGGRIRPCIAIRDTNPRISAIN